MLTPPYHFSLVSSAAVPAYGSSESYTTNPAGTGTSASQNAEVLYRGSIPTLRNFAFVKRLKLRTLVVLRKKKLKEDDSLVLWAEKRGVELKWVKAEEMGEEKLGMGKNEVAEVLKIILEPKAYPLYIADIDGISHTTLVVACLRKLQGWHTDSIINEICRFEPDHDDLPLVPFLTSYLSPPSASSSSSSSSSTSNTDPPLVLPSPPYPTWLWPTVTTSAGPWSGVNGQSASQSQAQTSQSSHTQMQPHLQSQTPKTSRERSTTVAAAPTPNNALPFPHPLNARKHPSMRVTFPPLPAPASASTLASASASALPPSSATSTSNPSSSTSPVLAPSSNTNAGPNLGLGLAAGAGASPGLTRTSSRRDKSSSTSKAQGQNQAQSQPQHKPTSQPRSDLGTTPGPREDTSAAQATRSTSGQSNELDQAAKGVSVSGVIRKLASKTSDIVGGYVPRSENPTESARVTDPDGLGVESDRKDNRGGRVGSTDRPTESEPKQAFKNDIGGVSLSSSAETSQDKPATRQQDQSKDQAQGNAAHHQSNHQSSSSSTSSLLANIGSYPGSTSTANATSNSNFSSAVNPGFALSPKSPPALSRGKSLSSKTNSPTKMNQVLTLSSSDYGSDDEDFQRSQRPGAGDGDAGTDKMQGTDEVEVSTAAGAVDRYDGRGQSYLVEQNNRYSASTLPTRQGGDAGSAIAVDQDPQHISAKSIGQSDTQPQPPAQAQNWPKEGQNDRISEDGLAGTQSDTEEVSSGTGESSVSDEIDDEEQDEDEDEDDDDDDDDDDEADDDEDDELQPTSQYISALDLAGFG